MTTLYEKTVSMLQSQGKFYINLGLERVLALLDLIGNPQDKLNVIHIAGTNGKGSVCSSLSTILDANGYKVGLYTSPHLVEYTERIKINGEEIPKDDFANYVEKICNIADANKIGLTEFEILTCCAFLYFFDNEVDYVILETGLGGRFDATNVCKSVVASVITSISLDHIDRLGDTVEKIAFEKAGIIKENCPVVVSVSNFGLEVVKTIVNEKKADLFLCKEPIKTVFEKGVNYAIIAGEKIEFSLLGLYQEENLALVLKTLEIIDKKLLEKDVLKKALKKLYWGARLEYIKEKNLLIDGAHNPDSAKELKKSLDYYFPKQKRIFIYSTINTKDYVEIAKTLFNQEDEVYYLEFSYPMAVKFEEYKQKVDFLPNMNKTDEEDLKKLLKRKELKVLTGSFYMIGEVYNMVKKDRFIDLIISNLKEDYKKYFSSKTEWYNFGDCNNLDGFANNLIETIEKQIDECISIKDYFENHLDTSGSNSRFQVTYTEKEYNKETVFLPYRIEEALERVLVAVNNDFKNQIALPDGGHIDFVMDINEDKKTATFVELKMWTNNSDSPLYALVECLKNYYLFKNLGDIPECEGMKKNFEKKYKIEKIAKLIILAPKEYYDLYNKTKNTSFNKLKDLVLKIKDIVNIKIEMKYIDVKYDTWKKLMSKLDLNDKDKKIDIQKLVQEQQRKEISPAIWAKFEEKSWRNNNMFDLFCHINKLR